MELSLNNVMMEGYACLLDTTVFQEETQESIVPDACPDIGRVLCTQARAQLRAKESVEGKVEGEGSIAVTVVYLPEGEDGPRKLSLSIPFRVSVAAAGIVPGGGKALGHRRGDPGTQPPQGAVPRRIGSGLPGLGPRGKHPDGDMVGRRVYPGTAHGGGGSLRRCFGIGKGVCLYG